MKKTLVFLLLTLFCTSLISPLRAANEDEKKYDIASGEMELVDFIEEVRQIVDMQIIYDTTAIPKRKIHINIKPKTQTEYLALLKTILSQQGLLFYADGEGDGRVYFICKQSEISKLPLNPDDPDGLSLVVIPIKHVSTSHITSKINSITGTAGRPGAITQIEQTNSLIIKGTTEYIDFITELIAKLDVVDAVPVTEIVHLRYKDPAAMIELYNSHQKAVQANQKTARPSVVSMTPDEGNKSVIITASQREIAAILDFIKKFDVEPARDPAQEIITTEYAVNNLSPEEVARMINEVFQTRGTIVVGADKSDDSTSSSKKKKDSEEVESVASPFDIDEYEKPIIVYGQGQRTLIITTSRRIHERIVKLMEMIDKQTPLVFIQAALVSVAYGEGLDIGVQFSTIGKRRNGTDVVGTSNFGLTDLTSNAAYRLDVMTDIISRGLTLGIAKGDDNLIPFLINLSQTTSDVKVHSMPSVMTDNEKTSTFVTKDNAPVKVIKESAEGGTSTTSSEYESADISISITPSIREGGKIKLNLALVIESFSGTSSDPGLAPPKVSNNFNGDITVTDGKTLVIGGLISEKTSNTTNQIPLLGDLPIIGFLFRSTSESVSKDVLYIFITASILRTQEDEDKLTEKAQKNLEDARKSAKKDEKEAEKEDEDGTDNDASDNKTPAAKSADEKPGVALPKDDTDEDEE